MVVETSDAPADHAETAGRVRGIAKNVSLAQPGDPRVRLARAVVELAASKSAPLRLPLGSDTVAAIEAKNAFVAKELADWRAVATSTDFPRELSVARAGSWARAFLHSRRRVSIHRCAAREVIPCPKRKSTTRWSWKAARPASSCVGASARSASASPWSSDAIFLRRACPNIACLPSKNVIHTAKVASYFRRAEEFGMHVDGFHVGMAGVHANKERMASRDSTRCIARSSKRPTRRSSGAPPSS